MIYLKGIKQKQIEGRIRNATLYAHNRGTTIAPTSEELAQTIARRISKGLKRSAHNKLYRIIIEQLLNGSRAIDVEIRAAIDSWVANTYKNNNTFEGRR